MCVHVVHAPLLISERDLTPQVGQIVPHLFSRDGQTVPPLAFHPALKCRFVHSRFEVSHLAKT
jgi:hypothetical protein